MNEVLLIGIALMTSVITAIFGLGGGLMLIAFMPGLLPAVAIIPVHSVAQLASNASRAALTYRAIQWEYGLSFLMGSVFGGLFAAQLTQFINLDYIPLFIGAFILFNVWGPKLQLRSNPKGEFVTIGFLQTALGMVVGATGPMGLSTLVRKNLHRDALVVTSALFMTITHTVKIILFGFIGFSFAEYWQLCVGMVIAVILGSLIGTHMRHRVADQRFHLILKLILTALAIRMIVNTLW